MSLQQSALNPRADRVAPIAQSSPLVVPVLPPRCAQTLAAVVGIETARRNGAIVGAKQITHALGLRRRGLEAMLQALVGAGILEGVRGPRGGYRLARDARSICAGEIVRVSLTAFKDPEAARDKVDPSFAVCSVVVAHADAALMQSLDRVSVAQMADRSASLAFPAGAAA